MKFPEWIKLIPATDEPLSCHCFVIKDNDTNWIFDVGACNNTLEELQKYENTNIVLSHFHEDHISNIDKLNFNKLYQGDYTFRHTNTGEIVNSSTTIGNVRLFPLPNTHAKGSVAFEINGFAFLGDAIFPTHRNGHHCYNATLLKEEIEVLKACDVKYFVLAHNDEFIYEKEDIIKRLERVYSLRSPQKAYINLD